jgi:hypothetical protein
MLSSEEWSELFALKNEISYNPAAVIPEKQELFTQLLIRSFEYRGEAFIDVEEPVLSK